MNGVPNNECVVMLKEDYDALLLRAKAMCHALGGKNEDCQWP
jgi:hypothetical protein